MFSSLSHIATALVLFFGLLVAYTLVLYPLVLGLLARLRNRPILSSPWFPSVSAIIPVHNGASFIARKIESLLALEYPREKLEILVVSDGSTDSTAAIVQSFAHKGVRLLEVPKGGKPAALNAAFPLVSGEILLLTDVRQTLEPSSLARIAANFSDPTIGVVSGDLQIRSGDREQNNVGLYWRYERWIRKQLSRIDSTLGATGPIYCIRRSLLVPFPKDTLLDDMYLPLAGAFLRGFRLAVEPTAIAYDLPTDIATEFGRKVRTLAGNYQILWQLPALLTPRNRMLGHYLSYKILRLLLPWNVLGFLLASCLLPSPWRWCLLAPQAAFALLAVLDSSLPRNSLLKRLSSPASAFASMLLAAACAIAIFWTPPQKLWKPTNLQHGSSAPLI